MKRLSLLILLTSIVACNPPQTPTLVPATATSSLPTRTLDARFADLFAYDATQDLAVEIVSQKPASEYRIKAEATVYDLTYASQERRVSAYLLIPSGTTPHPAIVFGHPTGANRDYFLNETRQYLAEGIACLLITTPYASPFPPQYALDQLDYNTTIASVIDTRRGLDFLQTRSEIDPERLGYVGVSVGAIEGILTSAVDRRLRATAVLAGVPRSSDWQSFAGASKKILGGDQAKIDAYLAMMDAVEPVNYASHTAPTAMLYQFGEYDPITPKTSAEQLFALGSEPKKIGWHPDGHTLQGSAAQKERLAWMITNLSK